MTHQLQSYFINKSESEKEEICDVMYKYSIEHYDLDVIDYLIRTFPEKMFFNCIMYNDVEMIKMMVLEYRLDYHKRSNMAIKKCVLYNHSEILLFLIDHDAILYNHDRNDNRMIDEHIEKIGILSFEKINL
jgi:hypothetical protein